MNTPIEIELDKLKELSNDQHRQIAELRAELNDVRKQRDDTKAQKFLNENELKEIYLALDIPWKHDHSGHEPEFLISKTKRDLKYAQEHLTLLAKFIGRDGMTWAHVVSHAVGIIKHARKEPDDINKG